jgi:ribonucleoside-diphosphate reductase alpha chain
MPKSLLTQKMTPGEVTGANVSVKIDDEFMQAVINNTDYLQCFPIDTYPEHLESIESLQYDILYTNVHNSKNKYFKKINAGKLWKKIIYNAWKSAEPGNIIWSKVLSESIPDCYIKYGFRTVSTNPCGEIPLCPNDSCRLLSLNLLGYVVNPFTKNAYFDFDLFEKDVVIAQRYMDDIIDLEIEKIDAILEKIMSDPEDEFIKSYEKYLWEQIKDMTIKGRRTGLGVTAEGDMLAALGLIYGTDDAMILVKKYIKH